MSFQRKNCACCCTPAGTDVSPCTISAANVPAVAVTVTWNPATVNAAALELDGTFLFVGFNFCNGTTFNICPDTYARAANQNEQWRRDYGGGVVSLFANSSSGVSSNESIMRVYDTGAAWSVKLRARSSAATTTVTTTNVSTYSPTIGQLPATNTCIQALLFGQLTTTDKITIAWQKVGAQWAC